MNAATSKRAKPLTDEQRDQLRELIRTREFDWWFQGRKVRQAQGELQRKLVFSVSLKEFKQAREECRWYRKQKLRRASANTMLSSDEWERLRSAVRICLDDLQGRTIEEAVAIVSLHCRCNTSVLRGLRSDLRVWRGTAQTTGERP